MGDLRFRARNHAFSNFRTKITPSYKLAWRPLKVLVNLEQFKQFNDCHAVNSWVSALILASSLFSAELILYNDDGNKIKLEVCVTKMALWFYEFKNAIPKSARLCNFCNITSPITVSMPRNRSTHGKKKNGRTIWKWPKR